MRRIPKILRPIQKREREWSTQLSAFPVAFAAQSHAGEIGEFVTVPRVVLGRLIEEGKRLSLYSLSWISLHGAARLDNMISRKVSRDLKALAATTADEELRGVERVLTPVLEQVLRDSRASLLIAAGK
jgi:hypothetical protein